MKIFSVLLAIAPTAVSSLATRPMRVTVFGGTGYVGSAVCERLIKRGHEVTAVSRRGANPKPDSAELSRVKWVKGDATDAKTVEELLNNSDAAVHAIGKKNTFDNKFFPIVLSSRIVHSNLKPIANFICDIRSSLRR